MRLIEPQFFMLNCKYIGSGLSYEDYLFDILNWSSFFKSKTGDGSDYIRPESESLGEADASSTGYQIDFKLLINEEMMRGLSKNTPTVDKTHLKQGFIMINDHPNPAPVAKRNVLLDIMNITDEEIKTSVFKSDTASHFMKNLTKDKNLFLYYPYEYSCSGKIPLAGLLNMFAKVFQIPLRYRTEILPERDTFFCFKVKSNFLIFEWISRRFVYRDSVPELLCSSYMDFKHYSFY